MARDKITDPAPGNLDKRSASNQRGQAEDRSGRYAGLDGRCPDSSASSRPLCKGAVVAGVLVGLGLLAFASLMPGRASGTLQWSFGPQPQSGPSNRTNSIRGGQHTGGPQPLPGRCDSANVPKESKCTGCPPMYEGKLCASTTRYNDRTKGSCGCGRVDPVPEDWWTLTNYTAALNCINLDPERPLLSWCPAGCGGCFRLCSTGGTTSGKPGVTKTDTCRTFTVTNRCGDGYRQYPEWCSNELTWQQCQDNPALCKQKGSTNKFGYPAHFDLQDYHLQVSKDLGWDNAEVTFEAVPCEHWQSSAAACPSCAQGNLSFI